MFQGDYNVLNIACSDTFTTTSASDVDKYKRKKGDKKINEKVKTRKTRKSVFILNEMLEMLVFCY